VPFSIGTSYWFPVRLSVMVKVFVVIACVFSWLVLDGCRGMQEQINSETSH